MSNISDLFGRPAVIRITGRIKTRLGSGRFTYEDAAGQIRVAESDKDWAVGRTVTVIEGRIIGTARPVGKVKTYLL